MDKDLYKRKALSVFERQIPNVYDIFDREYIKNWVYAQIDKSVTAKELDEKFMDVHWDKPIRRCDICGKLMWYGYYLGDYGYACKDECLKEIYKAVHKDCTDESVYKIYLCDHYEIDESDRDKVTLEQLMRGDLSHVKHNADGSDECYFTIWN